jgi:hypothetical protein
MFRVPEVGFLIVSVCLYLGAFAWSFDRGPNSFLAGIMTGCGSIAMGVWIGLVITHHRGGDT